MELAILILSAFITSSISAVIGMGGGIILLGIMAIIIPEGYMVIALHGIIQLISNTTRTYVFKNHLKKKLIKEFSIGSLAGAGLSALIIFLRSATTSAFFDISFRSIFGIPNFVIKIYYSLKAWWSKR